MCIHAFVLVFFQQHVKAEIATLKAGVVERQRPFGEHDVLIGVLLVFVHTHERERVAANNILRKDERGGPHCVIVAFLFAHAAVFLFPDRQQPFAADGAVVAQNVHTVKAAEGQKRVAFPIIGTAAVLLCDHTKLARQNFGKKVAVAARRFQKAGINALRFLFHKVTHGFHFAFGGKYFAVICHALFGFYLLFHEKSPKSLLIFIIQEKSARNKRNKGSFAFPTKKSPSFLKCIFQNWCIFLFFSVCGGTVVCHVELWDML